jgi:hypothetical protein
MKIEHLVQKLFDDPNFRQQLKADPRSALQSAGFEPTDQQVQALKNLDWKQVSTVAQAFGSAKVGVVPT